MKIAILQTDHLADSLISVYGDYDKIYGDMLRSRIKEAEIIVFPVVDDIFPQSIDDADGYIITGSKYGAYEDVPFIHRLKLFIQDAAQAKKAIFGICFGHQIIAEALGGKVEKWQGGWNCGVKDYHINDEDAACDFPMNKVMLNAFHQDQIVELPKTARPFLSTQRCQYAGISYFDGQIMSLQPHPEFSNQFTEDLTKLREDRLGEDVTQQTLASLVHETKGEEIMDFIADFFSRP